MPCYCTLPLMLRQCVLISQPHGVRSHPQPPGPVSTLVLNTFEREHHGQSIKPSLNFMSVFRWSQTVWLCWGRSSLHQRPGRTSSPLGDCPIRGTRRVKVMIFYTKLFIDDSLYLVSWLARDPHTTHRVLVCDTNQFSQFNHFIFQTTYYRHSTNLTVYRVTYTVYR